MIYNPKTRRQFLLGAGGAFLALPVLPSLLPRNAYAAPKAGGVIYLTTRNGCFDLFTPTGAKVATKYDSSMPSVPVREMNLADLPDAGINRILTKNIVGSRALQSQITVLTRGDALEPQGHGHDAQGGGYGRPSVDQLLARHPAALGKVYGGVEPVRRSVVVGNMGGQYGHRSESYWYNSGKIEQISALVNLQALWNYIFGVDASRKQGGIASMNVLWRAYGPLLKRTLSKEDQTVFFTYYQEALRAAQRLQNMNVPVCPSAPPVPAPSSDLDKIAAAHTEILPMALACGYTRVVSIFIQTAKRLDNQPYSWGQYHEDTHNNIPPTSYISALQWIGARYFMPLVNRLNTLGLLPTTTLAWLTDCQDGRLHNNDANTTILAGQGGGLIQPGRFLDTGDRTKPVHPQTNTHWGTLTHNFHNTMLKAGGLDVSDVVRKGEMGWGPALNLVRGRDQMYRDVYKEAGKLFPLIKG